MNNNPTTIPPVPLKIVTASLIMLFVVAPILALVKSGQVASIPLLIAGGLTCVALALGLMFLHRIILWIHYRFYWYVMAVFYAIVFMICLMIVFASPNVSKAAIIDTLPAWVSPIFVLGAIVGLIAIALIFRHRHIEVPVIATPPTPAPTPTPQKHALDTAQQLAARRKGLGLDDKGTSN